MQGPLPKFSSSTYRFLAKYSVSTSQPNILDLKGGKYDVPDESYPAFLELLGQDAMKYALGLVERKRDHFPFLLDVDFPGDFPEDRIGVLKQLLTNLRDFVVKGLLETLEVADPTAIANILVFDEARVSHRNLLKFHVVFPRIVVDVPMAQGMTAHVQACMKVDHPSYDWVKIIDASVAGPNGLRMLGCYKPDVEQGYYVPCRVDWDAGSVQDLPVDVMALTEHSIRVLRDDAYRFVGMAAAEAPSEQASGANSEMGIHGRARVPLDVLRRAVMALPESFWGRQTYDQWTRIVWTIQNVAEDNGYAADGLQLAHEFSCQADAATYDERVVERLYYKAWKSGTRRLGWSSLLRKLGEHDQALAEELAKETSRNEVDGWNQNDLAKALGELLGLEYRGGEIKFTFGEDKIDFEHSGRETEQVVTGKIHRDDGAIFVDQVYKGHIANGAVIPESMSIIHSSITDDMRWAVTFENENRALLRSDTGNIQATMQWHNAFSRDSYVTVNVGGARRGTAVQRRSTIQYLEERVKRAVRQTMEERFGVTAAFFQNCVFNINITPDERSNRHAEGILNKMLLEKRPHVRDVFRFAPDVKSANCNGLFRCNPDTHLWEQVHNSLVEEYLREQYVDLEGLTPEDRSYTQTRRGIADLRCEFAGSVIDPELMNRLDASLDIFPLKNGVVDMEAEGMPFRETRPDDFVRLHAGWAYDRDQAASKRAEVEEFLAQLFPVAEERAIVLRYVAGLLSGRRAIKKMLILTDKRAGNNGKSTFVNFLRSFFGALTKSSNKLLNKSDRDRDRDSHDAGLEQYAGIRLSVLEELKKTTRWDEGLIKWLTGGSGVQVEGRRCGTSDTYSFVWQSGLIAVFNEGDAPGFDVGDEAFIGRLLVAPMRSKFVVDGDNVAVAGQEDQEEYVFRGDAEIEKKFKSWRSAFLDILKEAYRTQNIGDVEIPDAMKEWRAEIVEVQNKLAEWLEGVIERTDDKHDIVLIRDLNRMYASPGIAADEFTRLVRNWVVNKRCLYKANTKIKLSDGSWKGERHVVLYARFKVNTP
jgi:hypothetical protein